MRFRHPLVRSAVYRAAPCSIARRRTARWPRRPIRTPIPIAARGIAPRRRSGPTRRWPTSWSVRPTGREAAAASAAAAAFLERATELTPDPARRGARALAAAQAKFEAGGADTADELLAAAELGPLDELQRARLERLRAQIVFARGAAMRLRRYCSMPPNASSRSTPGWRARRTSKRSERRSSPAAWVAAAGCAEVAEAARAAPPGPQPPVPIDLLLDGLATRFTEGYAAGVPPLRRALRAFRREDCAP